MSSTEGTGLGKVILLVFLFIFLTILSIILGIVISYNITDPGPDKTKEWTRRTFTKILPTSWLRTLCKPFKCDDWFPTSSPSSSPS